MWTARFFSPSINSSTECDHVNPCAQHRMQKTSGQKINKKDMVEKQTIFHITFLFIIFTTHWYFCSYNARTVELQCVIMLSFLFSSLDLIK